MYEVWTDGSCRFKKIKKKQEKVGDCAIAIIIKKNGELIHKHSSYIGVYDNNQAEYEALIYAIDYLIEIEAKSVIFYTDSNLVEKQMNDKYASYSELINPFYLKAKRMITLIPEWNIKWMPRFLNKEADRMASDTIEEWLSKQEQ